MKNLKKRRKSEKTNFFQSSSLQVKAYLYQSLSVQAVYGGLLFSGNTVGEVSPERDLHLFAVPGISNCILIQ